MNIWECFYMLIWTETGEKAVEFENYNKRRYFGKWGSERIVFKGW